MSHFADHHKPGSKCYHFGRYRICKKTELGLMKTEYSREVKNPSRFPPTPGKGEVFVLEVSYEVQLGTQLALFPYEPFMDDPFEGDDTLPLAA